MNAAAHRPPVWETLTAAEYWNTLSNDLKVGLMLAADVHPTHSETLWAELALEHRQALTALLAGDGLALVALCYMAIDNRALGQSL